ncbi:hypothetical protein CA830_00355, partial [Burkholderia multivorans]
GRTMRTRPPRQSGFNRTRARENRIVSRNNRHNTHPRAAHTCSHFERRGDASPPFESFPSS